MGSHAAHVRTLTKAMDSKLFKIAVHRVEATLKDLRGRMVTKTVTELSQPCSLLKNYVVLLDLYSNPAEVQGYLMPKI
jgi:hypothetical protein